MGRLGQLRGEPVGVSEQRLKLARLPEPGAVPGAVLKRIGQEYGDMRPAIEVAHRVTDVELSRTYVKKAAGLGTQQEAERVPGTPSARIERSEIEPGHGRLGTQQERVGALDHT